MTNSLRFLRNADARYIAIGAALAVAIVVAAPRLPLPTLLLWNASASVPIGLYVVEPGAALHTGDLAVSNLPSQARKLAADRGYLPADVLLIKPVAATAGSQVCRSGSTVAIDGRPKGDAQTADHLGRPLPVWVGCSILSRDDIFLMNPRVPDSFDGRYFGPTRLSLTRGRAFPVLTFRQP